MKWPSRRHALGAAGPHVVNGDLQKDPGFSACWVVVGSALACALVPATEKHYCWVLKNLKTATFLASVNLLTLTGTVPSATETIHGL